MTYRVSARAPIPVSDSSMSPNELSPQHSVDTNSPSLFQSYKHLTKKICRRLYQRAKKWPAINSLYSSRNFLYDIKAQYFRFAEQRRRSHGQSISESDDRSTNIMFHIITMFLFLIFTVISFEFRMAVSIFNWCLQQGYNLYSAIFDKHHIPASEESQENFIHRLVRDGLAIECAQLKEELRLLKEQYPQVSVKRVSVGTDITHELMDFATDSSEEMTILKREILSLEEEKMTLYHQMKLMEEELESVQSQYQNLLMDSQKTIEKSDSNLQVESDTMKDEIQLLKSANFALKEELESTQTEVETKRLQDVDEALERVQQAVISHDVKCRENIQENELLWKQNEEMKSHMEELKDEINKLQKERDILHQQNLSLEEKLNEQNQSKKSMTPEENETMESFRNV